MLIEEILHKLGSMVQRIHVGKCQRYNASASLLYGLFIPQILVDRLINISMFTPIVIKDTYDSCTFSSMGNVHVCQR